MNAGQSSSQHEVAPARRMSQNKYAVLLMGTVVVSVAATVFVRPRVGPWLELWCASPGVCGA